MFKKFISYSISLIAVLISGCAITPSDLQSRGPTASLLSIKSPESISICIVEKWENVKIFASRSIANYRPANNGTRITLYIDNKLFYLVDVDAIKEGSKITYYETWGTHFSKDRQFSAVESCQ